MSRYVATFLTVIILTPAARGGPATLPATLPATAPAAGAAAAPTPPDKYEVLIGEGLAGSGFLVRHGGALWGVCSLHQFEGKSPSEFDRLEGDAIKVDPKRVVKQKDVQALPVTTPPAGLQFLPYEPDFALAEGDELTVLGPAGEVVPARLTGRGLTGKPYASSAGPSSLELRTDKPFVAAGGSGGPVLLKKTGAVVGVLLSADDGRKARVVGFETLCLPKGDAGGGGGGGAGGRGTAADPSAAAAPAADPVDLSAALEPLVAKLPRGTDWLPERVEIPQERYGLAYVPLPPAEQRAAARATRQMAGFGGQGGPRFDEAVSFLAFEFADAGTAKNMPARLTDGYRSMLPIFRLGGTAVADVAVADLPAVKADAAKLVRARGTQENPKRPFTNTLARAARGRHMVELVLRNVEMTDKELAEVVTAALDRVEQAAGGAAPPR